MARPERTDFRARHSLLSGDLPALAKGGSWYEMVESFGFWRRKFCIKNAEILSVGKIAEFAKFAGGKRRKSPDRCLFNRAERVMDGCLLWLSKKDIEGKSRLTLMRVGST